jgi:hypothetical protein
MKDFFSTLGAFLAFPVFPLAAIAIAQNTPNAFNSLPPCGEKQAITTSEQEGGSHAR